MRRIICDLLLALICIWLLVDKDTPESLKDGALLGAIMLTVSITLQVLVMNGII